MLLFGIAAIGCDGDAGGRQLSTILAGVIGIVFVLAFFLVFWLRGRSQRKRVSDMRI